VSRFRNFIIHPIAFSAYPVLFLFSKNISEVDLSEVLVPLCVTIGICGLVWIAASLILKSKSKGALVASLSMIMLLLFGHAHALLGHLFGWDVLSRRHMFVGWCFLYLGGLFLIFRRKREISSVHRFANTISIILLLIVSIQITACYLKPEEQSPPGIEASDLSWIQKWRDSGKRLPHVYYIILDGYGRSDEIERNYQFKNDSFLETLKSRGFFVPDRSTSNYPFTHESIASSLNMEYIDENWDSQNRRRLGTLVDRNKVAQLFRLLGYKYIFIPSGYYITDESHLADITIDLGTGAQGQLESLLIESSAIWFVAKWLDVDLYHLRIREVEKMAFKRESSMVNWQRHINESVGAIGKVAERREPTFTFAHIICPHPPFVFKRDGSLNSNSKMDDLGNSDNKNYWTSKEEYIDQLVYLNSIVSRMIVKILESSPEPPIIILHGDHGTASLVGRKWEVPEKPSVPLAEERMAIFFACYMPIEIKSKVSDSITPVNLFRIVFNESFGANYSLLPNRNFWAWVGGPRLEVTEIVNNSNK
jgi:hypothetical protein